MITIPPGQSAAFGCARIELVILDLNDPDLSNFDELPPGQRERASRFATPTLVRRHIAAQVGLRRNLAHRLGVRPSDVRLATSTFGKPALAPNTWGIDLRFNLAHSADIALIAFAVGFEVGVDVEVGLSSKWGVGESGVAGTVLSASERAALAALPEHDRARRFLHFWVRKESVLKAVGAGLAVPLYMVDTASPESEANGSIALDWDGSNGGRIWWQDVALDEQRAAAAVACGRPHFELVRSPSKR